MDKKNTRYYNMDIVRYYLAICVIIAHLNFLSDFELYWPTPGYIRVGAFFTISGFLVYPSFFRKKNIGGFFKSRAYRIMPPYLVVIIIFSLILVFFSSLPASQYFLSWNFWKYLLANISFLNFLAPSLPGVFDSPEFATSAVNGAMWTMKVEWIMYLSVPIVAYIHNKFNTKRDLIFIIILLLSIIYKFIMNYLYETTSKEIYLILDRQFFGQTCYFYGGAFIYFHKESLIKHKWIILFISLTLWALNEYIPYYEIILKPFVVSVVVIWVCIIGNWGKYISRHDNVSYDLYLYHFPIIQIGIYLGMKEWPIPLMLLYVFGVTTLCAVLSWNLIGKRFKRLLNYQPSSYNQSGK